MTALDKIIDSHAADYPRGQHEEAMKELAEVLRVLRSQVDPNAPPPTFQETMETYARPVDVPKEEL